LAGLALSSQWFLGSVLVPIVIGVGSAVATHSLAVRKTRLELRLVERRKSYEVLLPAIADVVAYDQRELRMAYHEFGSQAAEDRAYADQDDWKVRHAAAMSVIQNVIAKRELAASPNVLKALDSLLADYSRIGPEETPGWPDAAELYAEASLKALDAIRKEIAREA